MLARAIIIWSSGRGIPGWMAEALTREGHDVPTLEARHRL